MAEQKKKRPAPKQERPVPEVIYTQPEPLDRKKLILRLATVAAVVVALLVGFSIFFRVDTILVTGNEQYSRATVIDASGIEIGDSLLSFGRGKASAKIAEALPYIKTIRIGVKLPGTVTIAIDEVDVVYSVQDTGGKWWLATCDMWLVEQVDFAEASKHTIIRGIQFQNPKKGSHGQVPEPDPQVTDASGEEVIITVTNKERLQTAKEILNQLERNSILGECANVDVTDMGAIQLWYGSRYQVLLGDPGRMEEKIDVMSAIIRQSKSYETGILDLTDPDTENGIPLKGFD